MGIVWKVIAAVIGGLIFAFLGYMAIMLPLPRGISENLGWLIFALWAIAIVIVWLAPSASKAWRRLLICSAIFCLIIPISTFIMSAVIGSEVAAGGGENAGAAAAGAMLGGGFATLITGFVSFFLAAIFLIVGLLTGRDVANTK
ncbi:hypothetical protein ACLUEY_01340 [Vreelandella aquamarina]